MKNSIKTVYLPIFVESKTLSVLTEVECDLIKCLDNEEYERAAVLRDIKTVLSDALLGYREWDEETIWQLFQGCIECGDLVIFDEESVMFSVGSTYCVFVIDQEMYEVISKLECK